MTILTAWIPMDSKKSNNGALIQPSMESPIKAEILLTAPEWAISKAEARREILIAWEYFCKGPKKTEAGKDFVRRYNAQNPNIGVSEDTFKTIKNITLASLYIWLKAYKKKGAHGLIGSTRRGRPSPKITPEMKSYIVGLLMQNPDRRDVRVFEYLEARFSGPKVSLPCEQTVRNFIRKWKAENRPHFTYLQNPEKWKSHYQAAFGDASAKAKHFLHFVEFDGTPADVICSDGVRHKIVAGVDIFSRKAKALLSPTNNSAATAGLFRWIILNWGLFDVAVMDNGRDYRSIHIDSVCKSLDITPYFLPGRTPEGKPHMERFFGSLSTGLFEELVGFCGHNVAQRKAIDSRKSVAAHLLTPGASIAVGMTSEELQRAIDDWIESVYHQRPQAETGKSPNQRAGESTKPVKRLPPGQESALDILLCPLGKRTVSKKGIRFNNGRYISPELASFVGYEVHVRQDLADIGHLWVFDLDGKFICKAWDSTLMGVTAEEAGRPARFKPARKRNGCRPERFRRSLWNPRPC